MKCAALTKLITRAGLFIIRILGLAATCSFIPAVSGLLVSLKRQSLSSGHARPGWQLRFRLDFRRTKRGVKTNQRDQRRLIVIGFALNPV
jgi:hypothetical protein